MAIVKKISELVPKGSNLGNTDLLIVGVDNGTDYDLKSVTGAQLLGTVVSQTITDSVTTKSPSENAVFDKLKEYDSLSSSQNTSTAIRFDKKFIHADTDITGKFIGLTGNITISTGVGIGTLNVNTQSLLIHNNSSIPTFSSEFIKAQDSLDYKINVDNYVICTLINQNPFKVSYRIVRDSNDLRLITTAEGTILSNTSGTNSGDENVTTIKTKLGITTLSGSNTGDQDLSGLLVKNTAITGATKTKITYDSKGLVTSGADATTADIADSLNKRYVTDANLTTIGNQSGTNTGDQDLSTLLVKSNNLSDLVSASTARTNLGLGSLATQSGTFSGTSSGTNTGDQIISDATITTTDITTNNFTTTKHGFVPKGTNTGKYLKDDGTWSTISAGGLTYFTESQNTTAPNATVNVDSLTAVTGTTNGDFAIIPKGTGAILAAIPNSISSGGNKRGTNAVDLQTKRIAADAVASGNNSVVIGGDTNSATGTQSSSLGGQYTNITGTGAGGGGNSNNIGGTGSFGWGGSNTTTASNCATFGSSNTLSQQGCFSAGTGHNLSNFYSTAFGDSNTGSGYSNFMTGTQSHSFGVHMRQCVGGYRYSTNGDNQSSTLILSGRTTSTTSKILCSADPNFLSANATTQLTLQNNNAMRVKGSIIAKQTGTTNVGAWDIDFVIVRGASAAATAIVGIANVNVVTNLPLWGTPTITADTTIGCPTITVTGVATTNIQWGCSISSMEVIY